MNKEEKSQKKLDEPGTTEKDPGKAAYHRHLRDVGLGIEALREALAQARGRGVYVYAINIRYPKSGRPGFFMMVKAYTEEGPVIAFHNGFQLVGLLVEFGARIRAGAVEWVPDEYPADGWVEELAFMHSQERNRE